MMAFRIHDKFAFKSDRGNPGSKSVYLQLVRKSHYRKAIKPRVVEQQSSFQEGTAVAATSKPPMTDASLPLSMVECALAIAARGFPVFPCKEKGKAPLTKSGFHNASTNPDKIHAWWEKYPNANIGMCTDVVRNGKRLVVADVDPRNGGDDTIRKLERLFGPLPDTVTVLTGGGGWHFFFWVDENIHLQGKIESGIDLKSRKAYVIAAGSVHASGQRYTYEASCDPADVQAIADAPDWIVAHFSKNQPQFSDLLTSVDEVSEAEILEYKADLHDIPASCSRDQWLEILMALHSRSPSAVMRQIADEWSQTSPEKYVAEDFAKTWASLKQNGGITIATLKWRAQQERAKSVDLSAFYDPDFFCPPLLKPNRPTCRRRLSRRRHRPASR
jgi:hypothetical protein